MPYKISTPKAKEQKSAYSVKSKSEKVIVDGKEYTLEDMRDWFIQIRGFPSILFFGKGKSQISGEGQRGGRYVTEEVHKVENAFVEKLGEEKYKEKMNKLMKGYETDNRSMIN